MLNFKVLKSLLVIGISVFLLLLGIFAHTQEKNYEKALGDDFFSEEQTIESVEQDWPLNKLSLEGNPLKKLSTWLSKSLPLAPEELT